VFGVDVAPEAIEFACAHYQSPNLTFERASVTTLQPTECHSNIDRMSTGDLRAESWFLL
jgi:hypothetical protein